MKIWCRSWICLVLAFLCLLSFISCNTWGAEEDYTEEKTSSAGKSVYILNIKSKKIHTADCGTGARILPENQQVYEGSLQKLLNSGYTRCGLCYPT